MFSASLRERDGAEIQNTAFLEPNLYKAPRAPQDAAQKRAAGQEKTPQKRGAVRTPFLNAALLALHYPRYIVTDEVA